VEKDALFWEKISAPSRGAEFIMLRNLTRSVSISLSERAASHSGVPSAEPTLGSRCIATQQRFAVFRVKFRQIERLRQLAAPSGQHADPDTGPRHWTCSSPAARPDQCSFNLKEAIMATSMLRTEMAPQTQPRVEPATPISKAPAPEPNWEELGHRGDRWAFGLWLTCFAIMALRIWFEVFASIFRP
jgi:hypothetical protein